MTAKEHVEKAIGIINEIKDWFVSNENFDRANHYCEVLNKAIYHMRLAGTKFEFASANNNMQITDGVANIHTTDEVFATKLLELQKEYPNEVFVESVLRYHAVLPADYIDVERTEE